jgi:DNA-binding CsgD family transcriptional regulator
MASRAAIADATASIVAACRQGHPPDRLKAEVLTRLRRVVPVDALWWATSDPSTLLFTQAFCEGLPEESIPYFVENEFSAVDVNQWSSLARDRNGVTTLVRATGGELELSARYRDVFQPMGLGDELRAVLRTGNDCWGLMCLHREAGPSFSLQEQQLITALAPHLAQGLRDGLLRIGAAETAAVNAPGLVVLDPKGELVAATAPAQAWFAELGGARRSASSVPAEVSTAAGLLKRRADPDPANSPVPRLRVRTLAGRWAVLHASWLNGPDSRPGQIAIIIESATPIEVAEVIMQAYGLTERERTITQLVCQGHSTAQIAAQLWITTNTVQDHLKSIFDKTGVRSRREVMARILRDHYLPGLQQARPVGPTGYFTGAETSP